VIVFSITVVDPFYLPAGIFSAFKTIDDPGIRDILRPVAILEKIGAPLVSRTATGTLAPLQIVDIR
jgi:hypothetical protein